MNPLLSNNNPIMNNQNPMNNQIQQILTLCQMQGKSPEELCKQIAQQQGYNLDALIEQAKQMMSNQ